MLKNSQEKARVGRAPNGERLHMWRLYNGSTGDPRPTATHAPQLSRPGEKCDAEYDQGRGYFQNTLGRKFTARLRGTSRRIGYEKAGRLRARSKRTGAARSVLESGGGFAQLLETYRLHLDFGARGGNRGKGRLSRHPAMRPGRTLIENSLNLLPPWR